MATRNVEEDPLEALGNLFSGGDENTDPDDPSAMTLVEHLEELRWRIFKSLIAIVVFSIVAFIFHVQLMNFLTWPLPPGSNVLAGHTGDKLVVTGVGEGFTTYLLVSLAFGFLGALPVILYQLWAFISPGLYAHEKKHAVPFIIAGLVLFVAGLALGYVVLQYPIHWLINFASDNFTTLISAGNYFTFIAYFMLAFGIVFEIPLVLTFLSIIGMITAETLTRKRAVVHVSMWIAATVLTPGADPYSPVILGAAMSFLFELSIIFIKVSQRMRERNEAAA
ncbi:MAG TPA: twin-arginine translocase subunit TatC [Ktedonobacteraceae bacterium]|nr:twin-arginine translocase subunit TatC [Ktedonobacteraceae bacterium]